MAREGLYSRLYGAPGPRSRATESRMEPA
jgi:hypothetical protein